jgi:hypothetical protein
VLTDESPRIVRVESVVHVAVVEEESEHRVEPRAMLRVRETHEGLDASLEVAAHEVGGADEVQRLTVGVPVLEAVDPGVLEIPTEDRPNGDVLRHAGNTRPHATDAAHDEVDPHAGVARGIERLDDVGFLDGVQLQGDATSIPIRRLLVYEVDDPRLHLVRGNEQLFVTGLASVPGEVVEKFRRIATDVLFAGEETDVLVHLRRRRVVVARREVNVPLHAGRFVANDEDALRMRLQADETVRDVHARVLELAGP